MYVCAAPDGVLVVPLEPGASGKHQHKKSLDKPRIFHPFPLQKEKIALLCPLNTDAEHYQLTHEVDQKSVSGSCVCPFLEAALLAPALRHGFPSQDQGARNLFLSKSP